MDLEALYSRLPISLQNAAVSLEGWRVNRKRYSAGFWKTLETYKSRTFWSKDEITSYRDCRLREFVSHAVRSVPYYRTLFKELRLDPAEIKALSDLTKLPVLAKQRVQECPEEFVSQSISPSSCSISHTSGTTGAGLRFPVTRDASWEQWATWWRYRDWHGIRPDTDCCYFGGRSIVPAWQVRPPYWRYNRAARQVLFSGYHLSATSAVAYLDEIQRSNGLWIHGYPSLIAKLASLVIEQKRNVPKLKWITTGAESLLPQQAMVIEEAFAVKPIEHYGMAEGVANFSMCPLRRLHVDEDYAAVEFLVDELGGHAVIGTNFSNPAMPLIRFDVGDTVQVDPDSAPCPCGRPGRTVISVDGRQEDYVVTKRGAFLGRLDHIFKDQSHVREAQIRQDVPGQMEVLIVKGIGFTERDERVLVTEISKRVGSEIDFKIVFVDRLERTKSNKLRFVVSSASLTS